MVYADLGAGSNPDAWSSNSTYSSYKAYADERSGGVTTEETKAGTYKVEEINKQVFKSFVPQNVTIKSKTYSITGGSGSIRDNSNDVLVSTGVSLKLRGRDVSQMSYAKTFWQPVMSGGKQVDVVPTGNLWLVNVPKNSYQITRGQQIFSKASQEYDMRYGKSYDTQVIFDNALSSQRQSVDKDIVFGGDVLNFDFLGKGIQPAKDDKLLQTLYPAYSRVVYGTPETRSIERRQVDFFSKTIPRTIASEFLNPRFSFYAKPTTKQPNTFGLFNQPVPKQVGLEYGIRIVPREERIAKIEKINEQISSYESKLFSIDESIKGFFGVKVPSYIDKVGTLQAQAGNFLIQSSPFIPKRVKENYGIVYNKPLGFSGLANVAVKSYDKGIRFGVYSNPFIPTQYKESIVNSITSIRPSQTYLTTAQSELGLATPARMTVLGVAGITLPILKGGAVLSAQGFSETRSNPLTIRYTEELKGMPKGIVQGLDVRNPENLINVVGLVSTPALIVKGGKALRATQSLFQEVAGGQEGVRAFTEPYVIEGVESGGKVPFPYKVGQSAKSLVNDFRSGKFTDWIGSVVENVKGVKSWINPYKRTIWEKSFTIDVDADYLQPSSRYAFEFEVGKKQNVEGYFGTRYKSYLRGGFSGSPEPIKIGIVGSGTSKSAGIYVAPSLSAYFMKLSGTPTSYEFGLFSRANRPTAQYIIAEDVREIPQTIIKKASQKSGWQFNPSNPLLSKGTTRQRGIFVNELNKFLETRSGSGEVYVTPEFYAGKGEAEGILVKDSKLGLYTKGYSLPQKLLGTKYYNFWRGNSFLTGEYVPFRILKATASDDFLAKQKLLSGFSDDGYKGSKAFGRDFGNEVFDLEAWQKSEGLTDKFLGTNKQTNRRGSFGYYEYSSTGKDMFDATILNQARQDVSLREIDLGTKFSDKQKNTLIDRRYKDLWNIEVEKTYKIPKADKIGFVDKLANTLDDWRANRALKEFESSKGRNVVKVGVLDSLSSSLAKSNLFSLGSSRRGNIKESYGFSVSKSGYYPNYEISQRYSYAPLRSFGSSRRNDLRSYGYGFTPIETTLPLLSSYKGGKDKSITSFFTGERGKGKREPTKRVTPKFNFKIPFTPKYFSSIEANVLNIKGTPKSADIKSGLGIRPIRS